MNPGQKSDEEKCFSLSNTGTEGNGVDHMTNFQRKWLSPFWVAFIDRAVVDANQRGSFYLMSQNTILTYHHHLKELVSEDYIDKLRWLKLPLCLMQVVNHETGFVIKPTIPAEKDIKMWAERYGKTLKNEKNE